MSEIKQSNGKAGEYCKNSVNVYIGCTHRCVYCYSPRNCHMTREQFTHVKETRDTMNNIKKQAEKYRGQEVFMSFDTDPYNPLDMKLQRTREAIQILQEHGVIPVILTKAGLKSTRDFDILKGKYGATLTFIDKNDSLQWEPGAPLPEDRFQALQEARSRGIKTWVSLEPVIDPKQTLQIIHRTHEYVDHYKVGKWNYDKRAKAIDWKKFLNDAVSVLKHYNKSHYIKEGLKEVTND